jgi:hypothetical protein
VLPRITVRQHAQVAQELDGGYACQLVPRGFDVVDQKAGDDRVGFEEPGAGRGGPGLEELHFRPVTRGQFDEVLGVLSDHVQPEHVDREGPHLRHPLGPHAEPPDALDPHPSNIPSRCAFNHFSDRRKEQRGGFLPRRTCESTLLCRLPERCPQVAVECEPQQGLGESGDVAGVHEESFAQILRQVWEVPSSPADHGQAERHRLSPDRPVWLARGGQDEDVGRRVERRDVLRGQRSVQDDAPDEVVLCKASPHTRLVTRLGGLVAREMERSRVGGQVRERFEELDDPFPRKPIGNREKRCSAPVTEVAQRTLWWRCHVPARGDDSDERLREPTFDELLCEVVARGEQDVRSPQREAIQRGLNPGSRG